MSMSESPIQSETFVFDPYPVIARLQAEDPVHWVPGLGRFGFGGPGALPRYAVRDFELRGRHIRKGQMLMLSFGGANRDPSVYADPDRLDLERDPKDLLTFGHGTHFCLGAHLARQEMRCMVDAALDFIPPGSRLREELMRFSPLGFLRRPDNLPVEFQV